MGMLVNGKWVDQWSETAESRGAFQRSEARFRSWVTADGASLPSGDGGFAAASGRYHLYVAMGCPWAHRTLLLRALKGLDQHIGVSVAGSDMLENGWPFHGNGASGDALHGAQHAFELYVRADPEYTGRASVPILWDSERNTIVSNESSEIIRMFNSAFDHITGNTADFYPQALRGEIDRLNDIVYANVNNGVYRCGFATSQEAYDGAFEALFTTLDMLEALLGERRYLVGDAITEADWRLLPTLLRFDLVYFSHFKCNKRRISDYPNLSGYTRELFQLPGVAETFDAESTKRHYYYSQENVNPTRIVPAGPALDFTAPHGRG